MEDSAPTPGSARHGGQGSPGRSALTIVNLLVTRRLRLAFPGKALPGNAEPQPRPPVCGIRAYTLITCLRVLTDLYDRWRIRYQPSGTGVLPHLSPLARASPLATPYLSPLPPLKLITLISLPSLKLADRLPNQHDDPVHPGGETAAQSQGGPGHLRPGERATPLARGHLGAGNARLRHADAPPDCRARPAPPALISGAHQRTIVALDIERSTTADPVKAELRATMYDLFDASGTAGRVVVQRRCSREGLGGWKLLGW